MRPLTARYLNLLICIGAIVLAYFSRFQTTTVRALMLVGVALLVALVLFIEKKFWVCPHCHKFIGRISFFDTTCPHCGKSIK